MQQQEMNRRLRRMKDEQCQRTFQYRVISSPVHQQLAK
jgi:hypothetical protein